MSDRDFEVTIDVVSRSEAKNIKRPELERRLYDILSNLDHRTDEYEGIADTLAMLLQIKRIAGQKGKATEKGSEVLKYLDLSNAKHSLKEHRDQLACALIANESHHGERNLSVIKDQLTHLMDTDISEVNRIWQRGREEAVSGAENKLLSTQIEDIKTAISGLTAKVRKSTGK